MPFATEAEVTGAMRSVLKLAPTTPLASHWVEIITRSVQKGRDDIVSALMERGFTFDQIEDWDRLRDYHLDQSRYWCLVEGLLVDLADYDIQAIEKLDRSKDLKRVVLKTADKWTDGGREEYPIISSARLNTEDEEYTRDRKF